jgi:hypothetical protein
MTTRQTRFESEEVAEAGGVYSWSLVQSRTVCSCSPHLLHVGRENLLGVVLGPLADSDTESQVRTALTNQACRHGTLFDAQRRQCATTQAISSERFAVPSRKGNAVRRPP